MCFLSLEKEPQDFPSCVLCVTSSWSTMPSEVFSIKKPNWRMVAGSSTIFLDLRATHQSRADPSTLVQPSCEVHNDLPSPVVNNDSKSADVTVLHLHSWEPNDGCGAWPDEDLAFASPLRIVDVLKSIFQDIHVHMVVCKDVCHGGSVQRCVPWWCVKMYTMVAVCNDVHHGGV